MAEPGSSCQAVCRAPLALLEGSASEGSDKGNQGIGREQAEKQGPRIDEEGEKTQGLRVGSRMLF